MKGKIKYIEEKILSLCEKSDSEENNKLYSYSLIVFNLDGNILKSIYKKENTDDLQTCKYDSNGKIIERITYEDDYFSTNVFKYDSNESLIEEEYYNENGELSWKNIYKYNHDKNNIEQVFYHSNGHLILKSIFTYDSNGNLTGYNYFGENDIIEIKETFKYDSNGNKIERSSYQVYSDHSVHHKEYFKYDEYGNIIERTHFYKQTKSKSFFEYELDEKKNWIKLYVSQGGKRNLEGETKIVYYGDEDENNYPDWDSPSFEEIKLLRNY
ncbi:MAG: hypothetical protein VB122_09335 [Erysipelotrichales bacterium]|nr:hypothetical protein [Erysipelotrichales bacterium]